MLLSEIVADIRTRLPHPFTNADVVRWINNKMAKIWPHIVHFTKDTSLKTVEDQAEYELPAGIRLEYIEKVRIARDAEETAWDTYVYKRPNESISGKYYYNALGGKIGISPIPRVDDLTIELTTKTVPARFTVDEETDDIDDVNLDDIMDPEFQEIFIYDAISIIAENPPYEDAARARYFRAKADEIFDLILERELRFRVKYGKKTKPNPWWRR